MSEKSRIIHWDIIRRKVRQFFTKNIGYKILSVLIALFVWSYVISQDPTLTRDKIMNDATISVTGADAIKRNGYPRHPTTICVLI